MRILITGSEGQLGWELLRQAAFFNIEAIGLDLPYLDITVEPGITKVFKEHKPDILINAAAYTNVDKAETDEKACFAVNVNGPENLAAACRDIGIPMIHISTDYVFDGTNKTPYTENDPVSPANVYGRSKAEGENGVRNIIEKHIILRTSWLYGVHGHNFVKTILKLGKEKEVIGVVSDQFGSPTSAVDLAETVLTIASRILNNYEITTFGTYNYCGEGITSWHGFAEKIIEAAKQYSPVTTTQVKPLTTEDYPTKAKRPAFSALDCSLIRQKFGITPKAWQKSLEAVIGKIYSC
ncbi:MAG: dTDP-4-dehydrorhamnose reductase, partial [Proteobacteria bacterium]|nr:dTDP-4-dehydrorhamnose reductase [Pseudomonadota bacterium]